MKKQKILLIEDEQDLADIIIQGLEEDNYEVVHKTRYSDALPFLAPGAIDLVLLDVLLPEMNGLEVCKKIRELNLDQLPILMVTALSTPENVVLGLDSGADDYLAKPFKLIELKARIRNLLRRKEAFNGTATPANKEPVLEYKFLKINDYKKIAYAKDQELNLTSTEYRLLHLFMQSPEKVFNRSELLEEVWGINFDIGSNVVDVYVNYLRRKIEKITPQKVIHTIIGMGYMLKIESE